MTRAEFFKFFLVGPSALLTLKEKSPTAPYKKHREIVSADDWNWVITKLDK